MKKGETLWSMSKKYGIPIKQIQGYMDTTEVHQVTKPQK